MRKMLVSAVILAFVAVTTAGAQLSMPTLTPEQTKQLTDELTRFGKELALSPEQKTQLGPVLGDQMDKIGSLNKDTSLTKESKLAKYNDIRKAGYEQIKKILSPEQLKKWDAEMAKAKDFLGSAVLR